MSSDGIRDAGNRRVFMRHHEARPFVLIPGGDALESPMFLPTRLPAVREIAPGRVLA
jgi:hypothetical protein